MWFLTQFKRCGLLKEDPGYFAVAKQINRIDLYQQEASQCGVAVPADAMRSSRLMDGTVWDGKDPEAYAASFEVYAERKELGSVPM
jgi:nitrate/nitrite transport system substrate-binding protein